MRTALGRSTTVLGTVTGVLGVRTTIAIPTGGQPTIGRTVAGIFIPVGITYTVVTYRGRPYTVTSSITCVVYRRNIEVITSGFIEWVLTAQIDITAIIGADVSIVTFHRYITGTGSIRTDVAGGAVVTVIA